MRVSIAGQIDKEVCNENKRRTIEMLAREPASVRPIMKVIWKKLKRDKVELFEEGWSRIEPKEQLFAMDAEYQEWSTSNTRFKGMRHKQFRRKHGIVRSESLISICESTYRHDRLHGL